MSDGAATSGFEFFSGVESELNEQAFDSLDFQDVVLRVFPLKANMNRLRSFCDRYLNLPGDDIAHFAPAVPYVFLQILNYGRMSSPSSNLGWVAQNEVVFNVPLVGRWLEDGKPVRDFASVAPFIFVDDEWSIATGREVYGWPKVLAHLTPEISPWMKDPRSRRRLMTLKTLAMAELYAGEEAEHHVLVQIEQEAPQLFGQIPPHAEYLFSPLIRLPKLALDSLATAPDFLEALTNLGRASGDPLLLNLLAGAFKGLTSLPPKLYGNTLNLKQFRASRPAVACYQSLVNARMQIKRFNAGGLLGSVDLMRGDPSAGYVIQIHRLPSFPIIESLGLEVDSEDTSGDVPVAVLRPLMPCWASLDLRYERGRRICWRTEDATWVPWIPRPDSESPGPLLTPALSLMTPAESREAAAGPVPDHDKRKTSTPFNTTLGPAAVPVAGPFDFFNAEMRVLPIRAKSKSLLKALPHSAHASLAASFSETGTQFSELSPALGDPDSDDYDSWVYLVVETYHAMSSSANDIGWWAKRDLGFAFLVKMEVERSTASGRPGRGKKPVYWLYWPYLFADSPIAVTEGREVLGLQTAFAELAEGRDPWLGLGGTSAHRTLLQLKTKDFPALGVGAGDIERLVLEIESSPQAPSDGSVDSGLVARFQRRYLTGQSELEVGAAGSGSSALAGYLRGVHVSNLSLKQFRDEEMPNRACYQALVAFERGIGSVWTEDPDAFRLEPLDGEFSVRFHRSPLWDITTALGLKSSLGHTAEGVVTAVCQAEDPFEIKSDIRSHLPTTLISRAVGSDWRVGSRARTYFNWRLLKAGILKRSEIKDEETLEELDRIDAAGEDSFLVPFGAPAPYDAAELAWFLESCLREPALKEKVGEALVEAAEPYLTSSTIRAAAAAELRAVDLSMTASERRLRIVKAWSAATVAAAEDEELTVLAKKIAEWVERPASKELIELADEILSAPAARAAVVGQLEGIDALTERSDRLELVDRAAQAGLAAGGDNDELGKLHYEMTDRVKRRVAKEWTRAAQGARSPEEFKELLVKVVERAAFPSAASEVAQHEQRSRLEQMLTLERLVRDVNGLSGDSES